VSLPRIHSILTPAERRTAGLLLVLMTIGATLETLGISLVIPAIAVLTRPDLIPTYPVVGPFVTARGLSGDRLVIAGMLALAVAFLIKTVFCAFVVARQTKFSFGVQARLSEDLFRTYLRQPFAFHLDRNSARLIANIVTEVREFTLHALIPSFLVLTEALVLLGIAILLLVVQPIGAVVVVSVMGLAIWVLHRATRGRVARWGEARQHHEGLRLQHLQQGLHAVKEISLLGREEGFLAQHRVHNVGAAHAARLHHTLVELPRLALEFLAVVGLTTLVLTMLAQGRDLGSIVPTLGLFAAAAFRLMPSVNRIVNAAHLLRYSSAVVETLHGELELRATAVPARRAAAGSRPAGVRLDSVSYTYPGGATQVLTNVSLDVRAGECIGLVGPSGAGKSTLVDVVLGLLRPDTGQVLVDGRDAHADIRRWQDQIGYVPQSIYLTDDTIRRNIAFGLADHEIDDAAVDRAVRAAQLEDLVASRPEGVQTPLGEHGVRLSGGQRQRLGIARALYHDPAVLVLDEATSALDVATERDVMDAVLALHGSKTILVVAHRPSTVERCDRVYRLEDGRVTHAGAPADVVPLSLPPRAANA
jgi:ABC-type multidrug transport system fused ATPase/permease subunit